MRTNSSPESGLFNPRVLVALLLFSLAALLTMVSFAADPEEATVTPTSGPVSWDGTAPGGSAANETVCVDGANCDVFTIKLSGSKADWIGKQARVAVGWDDETGATDYDVYIHKGGVGGPEVARSAGSANPEAANINPNDSAQEVGTGEFTVHVLYFSATAANQYKGQITIVEAAPPAQDPGLPAAPPTVPGVPRYYNYSPGPGVGETAGEPTVGFNLQSKRAMYISGLQTLRVTFPETGACDALWEDVSFVLTSKKSLDPILFTDQEIGRTFVSQLNSVVPPASPVLIGLNSLMAFTDDDGETWTPAQVNPPDGSYDHQNVGTGPYPASVPLGNPTNKGRAVYYCSQAGVTAFCSRSDDGGLNFGPSRNPYTTLDGCGGIHGHVKVAPDGTVYLPNRGCDGIQAVAVSGDAGETWEVRQVKGPGFAGAKPPPGILDPSIGIGADGTLYFAYVSGEQDGGHIRVAVSHDKGLTWANDFDIGKSYRISNAVFPTAIAGDGDRAAVAFVGTSAPGNHEGADFPGTWYAFVAHTYDGGKTWTTVNATPNDPVQRDACIWNQGGSNQCRNLLDFTGITKDHQGNVLYAFADGCIGDCVTGGPNSFSSKATVAKQSGGKPLLKKFDPAEPVVPEAACLSGRRDDLASYLQWKAPDNGGADLKSYKIFRGTSANYVTQLVGTAAGEKTAFTDRSVSIADPVYFYKIVAQNSQGDGAVSNIVKLTVAPRTEANGACAAPGIQVLIDPFGDASTQLPAHDITSVSVAEPQSLAGKIAFTIKVQDLTAVPPNFRWAVRFNTNVLPPDVTGVGPQDDWFVSFVSGAAGEQDQFTYGSTGVAQGAARVFTKIGDLDPASNITEDGTITLILKKSLVGNPGPGDAITSIFGSVRVSGPTGGTNETIPDSTGTGSYALRAADLCLPNAAPLAVLDASTNKGKKGVTVNFDASASSDPDQIDSVATYTFNWGDGSDDVTQSNPKISHTFNKEGLYAVKLVVSDSRGKVSANTAQQLIEVTSVDPADLVNISTRANVQSGDNVLIGGFIVAGSGPKQLILRGIGPSLKANGQPIPGRMDNPTLELYRSDGKLIARNDDWKDKQQAQIEGSGLKPENDRESAIAQTLMPGSYTVVLRGKGDNGGIGIVEAYDRDPKGATSRMANISSRGLVGRGDKAMIGGFIADRGTGSALVLIRGIGPSLKGKVPNALKDPTLELYDSNGSLLAANDNWKVNQRAEIAQTGVAPKNDREAAILAPVAPGGYTAVMRGADDTVGTGLVEVYDIK